MKQKWKLNTKCCCIKLFNLKSLLEKFAGKVCVKYIAVKFCTEKFARKVLHRKYCVESNAWKVLRGKYCVESIAWKILCDNKTQNAEVLTAVSGNCEFCCEFTFTFRNNFYLSRKYAVPKFATSRSGGTLALSVRQLNKFSF